MQGVSSQALPSDKIDPVAQDRSGRASQAAAASAFLIGARASFGARVSAGQGEAMDELFDDIVDDGASSSEEEEVAKPSPKPAAKPAAESGAPHRLLFVSPPASRRRAPTPAAHGAGSDSAPAACPVSSSPPLAATQGDLAHRGPALQQPKRTTRRSRTRRTPRRCVCLHRRASFATARVPALLRRSLSPSPPSRRVRLLQPRLAGMTTTARELRRRTRTSRSIRRRLRS